MLALQDDHVLAFALVVAINPSRVEIIECRFLGFREVFLECGDPGVEVIAGVILVLEGLDARQLFKGQVDLLDGVNVTSKSHLGTSFF